MQVALRILTYVPCHRWLYLYWIYRPSYQRYYSSNNEIGEETAFFATTPWYFRLLLVLLINLEGRPTLDSNAGIKFVKAFEGTTINIKNTNGAIYTAYPTYETLPSLAA